MRRFKPEGIDALYGISAELIAELCGVHITTARRWKRGEEPTFAALQLIKLFTTGDLVVVDLRWSGWRIKNGTLIAPDGMQFTPGDVQAGPFWQQLAKSYQTEQRLPRQGDWVSERWEVSAELDSSANVA